MTTASRPAKNTPAAILQGAPDISDYAFLSDCRSGALVSRTGSIDWCCMPRFDVGSCFGRLIDWETAGHFWIGTSHAKGSAFRRYVPGTLALETTIRVPGGEARVLDVMPLPQDGDVNGSRLVRLVEGVRGRVDLGVEIAPRFDYGTVRPWIRRHGWHLHSAIGGNDALPIRPEA